MVNSSEVRVTCPSVSFFFMRLGASLCASHAFFPLVENFVSEGSSLGVVLGDLFPFLFQLIDWFEGLVSEQREMFEVRSSELEIELLFSDNPVEVEVDIAVSVPREVRDFHTLGEVCSLDDEMLSRFRDRFQFLERVRVRLP
ncbi:hypothetical protein SO802_033111 [Lithocarpus litseifolius]|uniref:Uncharacterized protein n=1 Tax=Lithocarpus litseifolius TaxID=425828 RepID=A0AAW2BC84_9ROSI